MKGVTLLNQEFEWIQSFQAGDQQAFEELIRPHEKKVYNIALKLVKNEHDAYDLAQEALLKVYRALENFEYKSNFSTWLYRITYNTCLDFLRKEKKNWQVSLDDEKEDGVKLEIEDKSPTPEIAFEAKMTRQMISEAMDELDEVQRAVVVLRDVEGLTYDEIASLTDLNIGTVKSRINRGRTKLKALLMEKFSQ